MTARARNKFQIRLGQAASPERVAALANFVVSIMRAVVPPLPKDEVTLVVDNFNLKAEVRANGDASEIALNFVLESMVRPAKLVAKHPEMCAIIDAIAARPPELDGATVYRGQSRRLWARLDAAFIKEMRALAAHRDRQVVRGGTTVRSRILRIGQTAETSRSFARVTIGREPYEMAIDARVDRDTLYNAARDQVEVTLRIDCAWIRTADGNLVISPSAATIVGIVNETPLSGANVLKLIDELFPEGVDVAEALERLADA